MASSIKNSISLDNHISTIPPKDLNKNVGILCKVCKGTFAIQKKPFDDHYLSHNTEKVIYTCAICEHDAYSFYGIVKHLHLHKHSQCQFCLKYFFNLWKHSNTCNKKNSDPVRTTVDIVGGIFCHICSQIYETRKDFESHYFLEHDLIKLVYTCTLCKKNLDNYKTFHNHCYTMHVLKQKHRCNLCDRAFSKLSSLNYHNETTHNFKCPDPCNQIFSSKKDLRFHQITHSNQNQVQSCQICNEEIFNIDKCEEHVDRHSNHAYNCPICCTVIPNKDNAKEHLLIHFTADQIDSNEDYELFDIIEENCIEVTGGILCICDKLLKNKSDYDEHFTLEHKDLQVVYNCNICGFEFEQYNKLAQHAYAHVNKNRFQCEACDKTFSRLSKLVTHTEMVHVLNVHNLKPFQCSKCTQTYATDDRLNKHMIENHHAELKCVFSGCELKFKTLRELLFHQKVHNSSPQNYCKQCGLHFLSLSSCENHLELHRKSRYNCPICSRQYTEKYSLSKHLVLHFEGVLHICKVCGKSFNAKYRLKEHTKTHDDSVEFKCSYCLKTFNTLYKFKQHTSLHEKQFECTDCNKFFNAYSNYNKHMIRMHNTKPKKSDSISIGIMKNKLDSYDNISNTFPITDKTDVNFLENVSNDVDVACPEVIDNFIEDYMQDEALDIDHIESPMFEKELQMVEESDSVNHKSNGKPTYYQVLQTTAQTIKQENLVAYPNEYGPDFTNATNNQFIDLDENLPHIDPLLTIGTSVLNQYDEYSNNVNYCARNAVNSGEINFNNNWEPPILSKYLQNPQDFQESNEFKANILTIWNSDLF